MSVLFNPSQMRQITQQLTSAAGSTMNFRHNQAGEYDPALGTAPITTTTYTFKAAVFNYDMRSSGQTIGDLTIEANDRKLLVYPRDDVKPSAADWQVEIEGDWWTVKRVKSVASRGVDVYLELHVRLADAVQDR